MKGKYLILVILITTSFHLAEAQKIVTLKECYDNAMGTNALAGEKSSNEQVSKLKDQNIATAWLPSLDANGSFVYNSSVIDMKSALGALPIPGIADAIKPLPHEQYKVTLDINQTIYDGGAIKGARELEKAEHGLNDKQTEVDLYKLRAQINSCYFNILLLERQKELLNDYHDLLSKRISSMESAFRNGVINRPDIDVLMAEKLKLEQQLGENGLRKASLIKILSQLTGKDLDKSSELVLPFNKSEMNSDISRPELQLFDLRKEQLSSSLKIVESKRMPRAYGFASLGYGNPPGNNFFKNEFAPYYMVGAGLKWNIFDWNKAKNEKQIVAIQKDMIDKRKTDLTDNLTRLLESKNAEIESLEMMMTTDTSLISIRKRITVSADSKYLNGTITATDYLNELNAEKQAVLNYEIHKISHAMANIEYLNISGKEIE